MFDIPWMLDQYPAAAVRLPLLIIHGYSDEPQRRNLESQIDSDRFPNIAFYVAPNIQPVGIVPRIEECGMEGPGGGRRRW